MSKNKQDEECVGFPLRVPKYLKDEIDAEAKAKGVYRSEVAVYRLQHYASPLTVELLVELQNRANDKYEQLKDKQPAEAEEIQRKVLELWKYLN